MKILELLYEYFYYRSNPMAAVATTFIGFIVVAGAMAAWHHSEFNEEGFSVSAVFESVADIAGVETASVSQKQAAVESALASAPAGWERRGFSSSDLDSILGNGNPGMFASEALPIRARRDDFNDPNNVILSTYQQGDKLAVLRVEAFPFPISNTQVADNPDDAFRRELNMLDADFGPVAVHGVVFLRSGGGGDLPFRSYRAFLGGEGQIEVIGNVGPADLAELLAGLDVTAIAEALGVSSPLIDRRFGIILAHKPETYPAGFQPMSTRQTAAPVNQPAAQPVVQAAPAPAANAPGQPTPDPKAVTIRNGGLNQPGQGGAFGQTGNCRLENGVRRCQ